MTLALIARRLGCGEKAAKSSLKAYGLKTSGNRQSWTVRLDQMPKNLRLKLETNG